jgi:peroxiredoxin
MTTEQSQRSERIAGLIDDLSIEDLRRTTLQAIDHAHKSAAEVAQAWATYEGAMGTIAELRDENRRLRERIEAIEAQGLGLAHRAKRSAATVIEQTRLAKKRELM